MIRYFVCANPKAGLENKFVPDAAAGGSSRLMQDDLTRGDDAVSDGNVFHVLRRDRWNESPGEVAHNDPTPDVMIVKVLRIR